MRREVIVKSLGEDTEYIAKFHGFSVNYEEFENGPGNYPVAIVELSDGTIKVVLAEHITFIDNVMSDDNKELIEEYVHPNILDYVFYTKSGEQLLY